MNIAHGAHSHAKRWHDTKSVAHFASSPGFYQSIFTCAVHPASSAEHRSLPNETSRDRDSTCVQTKKAPPTQGEVPETDRSGAHPALLSSASAWSCTSPDEHSHPRTTARVQTRTCAFCPVVRQTSPIWADQIRDVLATRDVKEKKERRRSGWENRQ